MHAAQCTLLLISVTGIAIMIPSGKKVGERSRHTCRVIVVSFVPIPSEKQAKQQNNSTWDGYRGVDHEWDGVTRSHGLFVLRTRSENFAHCMVRCLSITCFELTRGGKGKGNCLHTLVNYVRIIPRNSACCPPRPLLAEYKGLYR